VAADHLAEEAPRMRLTPDLLRSVDAVVLLTDHDDIDYRLVKREARWILDCRDRRSGANVESL
jgi:UDP-N-acetyl-D-glucosamine dehydrogenase